MQDTKYESTSYSVKVGSIQPDSPIQRYLVVNKETGVIEFDHEVLSFVLEWLAHFQKRLDAIIEGKPLDEEDEIVGIVKSVN